MKTIIVVYTNTKITNKSSLSSTKRYSFNTSSEVAEEDLISTSSYDTSIQVVKVLNKGYKYYNASTGDLSDEYTSTNQREIKELVIREDAEDVVYGSIIKEEKSK